MEPIYIPDLLKAIKGNSGRFLLKKYPELKRRLGGGPLWNPFYHPEENQWKTPGTSARLRSD